MIQVEARLNKRSVQVASDRVQDWVNDLWDKLDAVVDEYADKVWDTAWDEVPVDTGNLRSTLEITLKKQALRIVKGLVGTNKTTYAGYQEFGTSLMGAQPYLRPALRQHAEDFVRECERVIKRHARAANQYRNG